LGVKRLDVWGDSQLVIDQVMKNASCHDDKMEAYCKAVRAWRTSSTASSSITCTAGTTRRRTTWPRSRPGGSPSPRTFLPATSLNPRSSSSLTPRATRNPRGSLGSSGCGTHVRGPLERGVRALPPRGVWLL
jgi:hypothetical protein